MHVKTVNPTVNESHRLCQVEVTAAFDYEAQQPDELSIKVGDVIKNVVMSNSGWWEGELCGKKGMFPDNYVKVIKKDDKDGKKEDERNDKTVKKDIHATQRHSIRDRAILKNQAHEGPPSIRKKEPGNKKKHCKVMYSFEPENDDELKLTIGEILEIVKQKESGWWEGILNGKQGMFPSNFVDIIADETESSDFADKSSENTDESLMKEKKMQGVGLGNTFVDGPFKLKSTANKIPDDKPSELPKAEKRVDPALQKQKEAKPIERAIVRFSYTAENEDELNLIEGEIITILEKELEDSGWWKGDLNGKVGVFPNNFVEVIKDELKPKKPPPPTQPLTKAALKLPEKASVTEPTKPEPVKEEKPALTQPLQEAIPSKRPSYPPPPLTKKPTKPADEKEPSAVPFDDVEPPADKLSHPTATRAKQPSKRPPSQIFTQNEEKDGIVKDLPWLKEEKPCIRQPLPSHKPDEEEIKAAHYHFIDASEYFKKLQDFCCKKVQTKLATRPLETATRPPNTPARPPDTPARLPDTPARLPDTPARPLNTPARPPDAPARPPDTPARPPDTSARFPDTSARPPATPAATASLQSAIDDLRKELKEIKDNLVTKTAFNELKSENDCLKQEIENVKLSNSKRINSILTELDDEKKIRLATGVEMERIRKMVAELHL